MTGFYRLGPSAATAMNGFAQRNLSLPVTR
jgi:hypothetical protein